MSEINKCPICGAEMQIYEQLPWLRLRCSNCPLDFGRYWFETLENLIRCWNNFVSPEDAREDPTIHKTKINTTTNNQAYEKLFTRR